MGLTLTYTPATVERMESMRDELERRLGVTVHIDSGPLPVNLENCGSGSSRQNCWDPIRAGVWVYKDSVGSTSPGRCTMGFHIYKENGTPKNQWLTAGHCVHPGQVGGSNPTKVYHSNSFHSGSHVGVVDASLYNRASDPRDIARVTQKFAGEASERIYGHTGTYAITGHQDFWVDEAIKFSGGTSGIQSGFVKAKGKCWVSEGNGRTVCGGEAKDGLVSAGGDSGAPVYRKYTFAGDVYIGPIGIVNDNAGGKMVFATLKYAFNQWNGWEVRGLAAP